MDQAHAEQFEAARALRNPSNFGRKRRLHPYSQALLLQDRIAEMIKVNGLAPSALASLSEQWVKLENYKLSVRPRKASVAASKRNAPPAPAQPTDDPHSHFVESPTPTAEDSP